MPRELHIIDHMYLGRAQLIASYVLPMRGGAVMIESGPGNTTAAQIRGLREIGLSPGDIRAVLLTHIHLDHAGAAGWWAQQGAQIYVHEFGAPHLVDPSKLLASAGRIYGEKMRYLWGDFLAVPAAQITALRDNDVLTFADVEFRCIETPGHAKHHHAFAVDDICFVGDAAAMILPMIPGCDFINIPAPPPEFDLEAWLASIDRLRAGNFRTIYPTHFGPIDDPQTYFDRFRPFLIETAQFIRAQMDSGRHRDEVLAAYRAWLREKGAPLGVDDRVWRQFVSDNLIAMSTDGIMRYWTKKAQASASRGRAS